MKNLKCLEAYRTLDREFRDPDTFDRGFIPYEVSDEIDREEREAQREILEVKMERGEA